MIVVDVLVVVLIVGALIAGVKVGLFAGLGWWLGLAAGGLVTPWIVPLVLELVTEREWRGVAVIGTVFALLALGAAIGTGIGSLLRRGADKIKLRFFERLAGGALGAVAMALAATMAGSSLASAGIPVVSSSVASSSLLRTIEGVTPDPVAEAMAWLRSFVVDDALPVIGEAFGQAGDVPDAVIDTGNPALDAASASVARISGVAYACGTGSTGSGFVAEDDLLVTNAHVVAGVESVVVELPGEAAVDGRVVYYDPVDDLAVVAAAVDAPALPVTAPLEVGSGAVVQGYPHGGPLKVSAATVTSVGDIPVDDVYGESTSPREVYRLSATVRPGNSGGPLLTEAGEVAGVVFARAENDDQVGYAMTTDELTPVLDRVDGSARPVSTGACTS